MGAHPEALRPERRLASWWRQLAHMQAGATLEAPGSRRSERLGVVHSSSDTWSGTASSSSNVPAASKTHTHFISSR